MTFPVFMEVDQIQIPIQILVQIQIQTQIPVHDPSVPSIERPPVLSPVEVTSLDHTFKL